MGRRRVVAPVPIKRSPLDERKEEARRLERAKKRAEELHAQGMPFQMAMAVAHGRLELNEALERMALNDRIARLMKKHDLSRALATQIAMGQADLDRVLYRRRMDDHRRDFRDRSVLDEANASGASLVLGLHGGEEVEARIAAVEPYVVQAAVAGQEALRPIHKLQVKYAYDPAARRAVAKARDVDATLAEKPLQPMERPQDRYACSDRRLYRYVDKRIVLRATLLEGERFTGRVVWFSRFEFQLATNDEPTVVVFRHALRDLSEV